MPQYRPGAVLHQQQGIETAAFIRAGQFDYQRSARRVKQRAADSRENTGEPEDPRLIRHGHQGKTACTEKHTDDDHRLGTEAVSNRTAEYSQPLLDKLAQPQSKPDHNPRPAELFNKTDGDQREDHKEAENNQQVIHQQPVLTQRRACLTSDIQHHIKY